MDIFFQDPSEIPLPPEEVRIRELRAEPKSDGQRVKIFLEVDPFQRRPSADVRITNSLGEELASTTIIESMLRKMEFTMHLRQPRPTGACKVDVTLFYSKSTGTAEEQGAGPNQLETQVVDKAEIQFEMDE